MAPDHTEESHPAVMPEWIAGRIVMVRGWGVMIDSDLAELYGVAVKRLNEQVKRNAERFPPDFAFQVTRAEYDALRSQTATLERGRGRHRKYLPWAFTEHGAIMAANVLNTGQAVRMSVYVVRGRSDMLSGKDAGGEALQGHIHAYYLPTDEDCDGRIDHLTVVARAGFDTTEMRAMDRLREIKPRSRDNASYPLRVLLLGYGELEAWGPDRVELAVQALVLRANGYRCDAGVAFYQATRQRVRIPMQRHLGIFDRSVFRMRAVSAVWQLDAIEANQAGQSFQTEQS